MVVDLPEPLGRGIRSLAGLNVERQAVHRYDAAESLRQPAGFNHRALPWTTLDTNQWGLRESISRSSHTDDVSKMPNGLTVVFGSSPEFMLTRLNGARRHHSQVYPHHDGSSIRDPRFTRWSTTRSSRNVPWKGRTRFEERWR